MVRTLVEAIGNIREDEALDLVHRALEEGKDPAGILADCQEGVKLVGDRFERGEYYLPELIMSGETLKKISNALKPKLGEPTLATTAGQRGKIVLGTVRGDIHDIGKNIVALMLEGNGFEVTDLGVDVAEETFVEAVERVKPHVVALSGLLTLAYDSMESTIRALEMAGLREGLKIMIGGGTVDEIVKDSCGADGYGLTAGAALRLATEWVPR